MLKKRTVFQTIINLNEWSAACVVKSHNILLYLKTNTYNPAHEMKVLFKALNTSTTEHYSLYSIAPFYEWLVNPVADQDTWGLFIMWYSLTRICALFRGKGWCELLYVKR